MTKEFPNKWVKKAVYDAVNNIVVFDEIASANVTIPCYDTRVPTNNTSNFYVILSTQTNQDEPYTFCDRIWRSTLLLDIVTIYNGAGNYGSNLMVNNITDAVRNAIINLSLSNETDLKLHNKKIESINNLDNITDTQNVFRNLMRLDLFIN
jgi:hypothetical protein